MENITLGQLSVTIAFIVGLISSCIALKNIISKPFEAIENRIKESNDKIKSDVKLLASKIDELQNLQTKIGNGTLNTLRQSIVRSSTEYLHRDSITEDEIKALSEAYQAYHDLGGDSYITILYDKAIKLKIREKDE